MPKLHIQTEEYWLHRVDYSVDADNLEHAIDQIMAGEVAYSAAEVIEGADEVEAVVSIDGAEVPEAESDRLLAEHKARRQWELSHEQGDSP